MKVTIGTVKHNGKVFPPGTPIEDIPTKKLQGQLALTGFLVEEDEESSPDELEESGGSELEPEETDDSEDEEPVLQE